MSRGRSAGIDGFRIAAAVMVIAIHTAPLSGISEDLDFVITYCIFRTAVPFFFMTTGYFVLAPWVRGGEKERRKVRRFLKSTALLYLVSTVLYVPAAVYSGGAPEDGAALAKQIFFDGTFYHLWYFPAAILGCAIVMALLRCMTAELAFVLAAAAYVFGTGGDSWYGLAAELPGMGRAYDAVFAFSSYTRNGIFYAPVFLLLGVLIRRRELPGENDPAALEGNDPAAEGKRAGERSVGKRSAQEKRKEQTRIWTGSAVSAAVMLAEGALTYACGWQRHNSMYLALVPLMYFLFRLLLSVPGKAPAWARDISMLVYVIHPAVLIGLRGVSGAAGLDGILVENTLVQFLSVTGASFAAAAAIRLIREHLKQRFGGIQR